MEAVGAPLRAAPRLILSAFTIRAFCSASIIACSIPVVIARVVGGPAGFGGARFRVEAHVAGGGGGGVVARDAGPVVVRICTHTHARGPEHAGDKSGSTRAMQSLRLFEPGCVRTRGVMYGEQVRCS